MRLLGEPGRRGPGNCRRRDQGELRETIPCCGKQAGEDAQRGRCCMIHIALILQLPAGETPPTLDGRGGTS
eukprot:9438458-Alexandrium_andersonii.AAC.1